MTTLPKYDRYKDCGVEWLGEIPEEWEVERNISIFEERDQRGMPNEELLSITIDRGVIKQSEITTKKDSSNDEKSKYKVVQKGDLAYNKMRAWQGALGISDYDGIVSPAYVILALKNKRLARYFHYLYRTPQFIGEANRLSYGLCDDMNSLRYDDFKGSYSPIPSDQEVDRIVRFLDEKTAQIDELIAKKQKQIKLLDEQKAILINRAVTRGLNPNAKLKPSGIEWIGDIPEGWEVVAFRRMIDAICDGPFGSGLTSSHYSDSGTRVIRLGNIGKGEFKNADKAFIPDGYAKELSHHEVLQDDLLVAGLGDSKNPVGRACVYTLNEPAIVKADCYRVRLKNRNLNRFTSLYLSSQTGSAGFAAATRGSTRSRVNLEITKEVWVVRPTKEDAAPVESYVAQLNARTLSASKSVEKQIKSLKVLRNSIIANAVVGRIKI